MAIQLPPNTYTVNVFNFGVDKNLPLGFVDAVLNKQGDLVGFVKNGKFYKPGEKVQEPTSIKTITSDQLSRKIDILIHKLNLNKTQAANTNISDTERNKYIAEYKKTATELSKAQKDLIVTQIKEGKLKEAEATKKAADAIRFDIKTLQQQLNFKSKLGITDTKIASQITIKRNSLNKLLNPPAMQYGLQSSNVVPAASMPFGGGAIPGMQGVSGPISGGIPVSGTTPAGTVSASTGATPTGGSVGTAVGAGPSGAAGAATTPEQRYAEAVLKAQQLYNMPDIIFKNVKSLGDLLKRFVNKELTIEQFAREIQNDPWYRQNSDEIKARYVQLFNYQDLVKTGRAQGTTNYEQEIARITRSIQEEARRLRGTDIPEADAKLMAQDLYIFNLDGDTAAVTERLARFITPTAGMIAGQPTTGYGGQALQNYQALQALAKANGYKIEDILPRDAAGNPMTAESTLQGLATGKLDIGRISQDIRKLAAQGQPDYVKQLLAQGYDLDQIYSPYKNRMAAILELNPDAINLNDSALRMGINKDGDLNLYDYEKMLRKDTRWQYTKNAREEVSNAAYQVLRDFGFQG